MTPGNVSQRATSAVVEKDSDTLFFKTDTRE